MVSQGAHSTCKFQLQLQADDPSVGISCLDQSLKLIPKSQECLQVQKRKYKFPYTPEFLAEIPVRKRVTKEKQFIKACTQNTWETQNGG